VRARAAGVEWMVCVGTDLESSEGGGDLRRSSSRRLRRGRLHPHDASRFGAEWPMLGEPLAVSDACIAIGECVFDLFYEHSPRDEQEVAFRFQIRLAKDTHKRRDPFARRVGHTFRVLATRVSPSGRSLPLLHRRSRRGRRRDRARYGAISRFSGIVSFKNADALRDAARLNPDDRILVETDSPFLTPEPFRGRPNEPALVVLVGAALPGRAASSPRDRRADARERRARLRLDR